MEGSELAPINAAARPAVTLVTALAMTADLSDAEYHALYERVAEGRSLRNVALALKSAVSFGWWAKYAAGEKQLDRERKNELRTWAGLPQLPPAVSEAVASHVHPDAAVYKIGEQIANRVALIGADVPAVQLRLNGDCTIIADPVQNGLLAACNGRYRAERRGSIHLSRGTWERLNAVRVARGLTWEQFLTDRMVENAD